VDQPEAAVSGRLSLLGLGRRFGGLTALYPITLDIAPGSCHGLIGPNGAGKSTLVNLVAGTLRPSDGRILLDGSDITTDLAARRARHGIGRTFQHPALFARLTVTDNLKLAVRDRRADVPQLVDQTGLATHARTPAGALPYGLQRRVELAMALAQRPRLLLLDEPSAGLDPDEITGLTVQLRALAAVVTVLLVEHNLDLVWRLADTVTVLHHGQRLATGPTVQVRADPAVHEAYLATNQARRARSIDTGRTTGAALLSVQDLTAGYYGAPIVHGIDLTVHSGETVAVLGRNGAGKTTLLSAVAGLLPVRAPSRIELDGRPMPDRRAHLPARAGIAIVPQGRRQFGPLTVAEHLALAQHIGIRRSPTPLWTVNTVLALLPALARRTGHQARHLSGGEQQMLALARALLANPRLLILDEPSEGLAPALIDQLTTTLPTLAEHGIAILMAEQNLNLATALADRVVVLDRGRVALTASTVDLADAERQERLRALLGVVAAGEDAEPTR